MDCTWTDSQAPAAATLWIVSRQHHQAQLLCERSSSSAACVLEDDDGQPSMPGIINNTRAPFHRQPSHSFRRTTVQVDNILLLLRAEFIAGPSLKAKCCDKQKTHKRWKEKVWPLSIEFTFLLLLLTLVIWYHLIRDPYFHNYFTPDMVGQ